VRAKTLLRTILGLERTRILDFEFAPDGLVVDVAPRWRKPRCSGCGRRQPGYDSRPGRLWRHLDFAGMKVSLRADRRRVECRYCGVVVEEVPWAPYGSSFTYEFEDMVGYLAQRTDKTTVSSLMRIGWATVGRILERVVERHGPEDRLDGLAVIGVDEISYRRHHKYLTLVTDHERSEVVWARPGKNADTLRAFFDELGPARCAKLKAITVDLARAFIRAIKDKAPQATIVFDRFHVQRLAHDALDEVRRAEVRELEELDDRQALKKTRWPLLKRPWNLHGFEAEKLSLLQRRNRRLYRAYLLKEALCQILDGRQVNVARRKLGEWFAWATRSRLEPFRKLAHTIRDHIDGILAYVRSGLSNGRTEALNGKTRTITRRSYGFHSPTSLIALIFLCCGGIHLEPVRTYPLGVA
jgi:transposase